MKITMCEGHCDWNRWLKSIQFCCSTMEEKFFAKTFGFAGSFHYLTIPSYNGENTGRIRYCPYCQEEIKVLHLKENKDPELSITLYRYSGNGCDYLTAFSICCEPMNILDEKHLENLPSIARPTNCPVEIRRGGIRLNGLIIKICPYCGANFTINKVFNFNIT